MLRTVNPNMGSNMKLTDASVANLVLPEGKSDHIEWDEDLPGFGLRLRRGSKRVSGIVQYRIGTQQRRESLGDIRKIGLEAARKIARQRFAKVELGLARGKKDYDKRQTLLEKTMKREAERDIAAHRRRPR